MILDSLNRMAHYEGLGKNFQTAFRFLENADLAKLPEGRFEIAGDAVYGIVFARALTERNPTWEAHLLYADIQIILDGEERIGWAGADSATFGAYNEASDFLACSDAKGAEIVLSVGQFGIFLPGEPHQPNNPVGETSFSKKIVVKVRIN